MVRRVRRPLVVGTGGKGSPPPAATAPKEEVKTQNAEVQAAASGCQGKECQTISADTEPVPKAKAEEPAAPGQDHRGRIIKESQSLVTSAATGRKKKAGA